MSEAFPSSPESTDDTNETDSTKKKTNKARRVPLPVGREETVAPPKVERPLLERLLGDAAKPEIVSDQKTPEQPTVELAESSSAEAETLAPAEAELARELYEGEIDLRTVGAVSPERDPEVVEAAVDLAEADSSLGAVEEDATELPVSGLPPQPTDAVPETSPHPDQPEDDPTTPLPPPPTARSSQASGSYPAGGRNFPPPGSSGRPPLPPRPPSGSATTSPASPWGQGPAPAGGFNVAPPPPPFGYNTPPPPLPAPSPNRLVVPNPEAEAEAWRNGRRRGLVAGLLLGGGIEHIRHSRREKRMTKKFQKEQLQQKKRAEKLEQSFETARYERIAEKKHAADEQIRSTYFERLTQNEQQAVAERAEGRVVHEKRATGLALEAERARAEKTRIQQQAEKVQPAEVLEVPKEHRVEHSAWHAVEVDSHGKAVQETSFEYGHEYYKERAKEVAPQTKQQVGGAAGEVALVAAALSGNPQASLAQSSSTPLQQSPTDQAKSPPSANQQSQTSLTPQNVLQSITTPPTTATGTLAWALVLVTLLVLLVIVIR